MVERRKGQRQFEISSQKASLKAMVDTALLAINTHIGNNIITREIFPNTISKDQLKRTIREDYKHAIADGGEKPIRVLILSEVPLFVAAQVLEEIGTLEILGIDISYQDVFEKIFADGRKTDIKELPTKTEDITVTVEIKTGVPPRTPSAPISDWASLSLKVAKKDAP